MEHSVLAVFVTAMLAVVVVAAVLLRRGLSLSSASTPILPECHQPRQQRSRSKLIFMPSLSTVDERAELPPVSEADVAF